MLNHVAIQGRLTRDPELRQTQNNTAVASFTLACDKDFTNAQGQREAEFIECVAWKKTAEFVSRYFTKGQMAIAAGRLQARSYTAQDGTTRKVTEVVVESMYFCGPKQDGGNSQPAYQKPPQAAPFVQPSQPRQTAFALDEDDDELPF